MPEPAKEDKGFGKRLLDSLLDPKQYAVLGSEFRRGLKDVQDAVLYAFPDSMHSRDEPGTIANPTQQLVTSEITGRELYGDGNLMPDDSRGPQAPSPQQPEITQTRGNAVGAPEQEGKLTIDKLRGTTEQAPQAPQQKLALDDLRSQEAEKERTHERQGPER